MYYPEVEQYFPAVMEVHMSDVVTPSFLAMEDPEALIVTFRLIDAHRKKVLQQVKQLHHNEEITEFFEDGSRKTFAVSFSIQIVFLDLPEGWENRDLWVDVISHKGNVIYSASVTEAER